MRREGVVHGVVAEVEGGIHHLRAMQVIGSTQRPWKNGDKLHFRDCGSCVAMWSGMVWAGLKGEPVKRVVSLGFLWLGFVIPKSSIAPKAFPLFAQSL